MFYLGGFLSKSKRSACKMLFEKRRPIGVYSISLSIPSKIIQAFEVLYASSKTLLMFRILSL